MLGRLRRWSSLNKQRNVRPNAVMRLTPPVTSLCKVWGLCRRVSLVGDGSYFRCGTEGVAVFGRLPGNPWGTTAYDQTDEWLCGLPAASSPFVRRVI